MHDLNLSPEEIKLFFEEAQEQLDIMEQTLLALEEQPGDGELVNQLFRAAHTLKGGTATVGLTDMAHLTHAMESLLDQVRQGSRELTGHLMDRMLQGVDVLGSALAAVADGGEAPGEQLAALAEDFHALAAGGQDAPPAATPGAGGADWAKVSDALGDRDLPVLRWQVTVDPDTPMASVRAYQALLIMEDLGEVLHTDPPTALLEDEGTDTHRLTIIHASENPPEAVEAALRGVGDIIDIRHEPVAPAGPETAAEAADPSPNGAGAPAGPLGEPPTPQAASGSGATSGDRGVGTRSVRVNVELLDELMNLVGELVVDRTRLASLARSELNGKQLRDELDQLAGHLSRITGDLQDAIVKARMIPVKTLFRKFPRMVRDLSRQLGKRVNFQVSGEDTELDRSVIELLSDPLIHLLRNALDHGVEPPEERTAAGKPPEATVRLTAYHRQSHIFVEVSDDGRGLDAGKIRRAVARRGLMTEDQLERLPYEQLADLIFLPGFSTADSVSTVSGRGVGMDVVRKNLEQVGGSITVRSRPGEGTTFSIQLPLTLAIIQALLVRIKDVTYALPLAHVSEVLLLTNDEIYPLYGRQAVRVRDTTVPLLNPAHLWCEEGAVVWAEDEPNPVVVIQGDMEPLALMVDRLIGEEEIVIKSLGPLTGRVGGISGASILGDGRVALIVDVPSLCREARQVLARDNFRQLKGG